MKSDFTYAARKAASAAIDATASLKDALAALNVSLRTKGNSTTAERLAHDLVLGILEKFTPTQSAIRNLASVILDWP